MAAIGIRDELPAALTLELFRLLRRVERADRLGRSIECRIVRGDANVREHAGRLPAVQRRAQFRRDEGSDLRLGLRDCQPERQWRGFLRCTLLPEELVADLGP